ncbi:ABC transporter permease [Streptomyces sp. NBC_01591]|uniref:ABC transporter permease n=1 Tax=Streptomyces sp. NBC_01591 TaxID=2975888 RepID=UPI002DDC12E0|nr:ABC transporter permease [Streptomyces sp. NBC_01591]WSD69926.1 ABC transporter permease [Streptomyces sp. NBC_01591]
MRELLLGLRLLLGSGRGNRTRFLLMVLGGSIGVCCLAAVLTIPSILDARDGRTMGREPRLGKESAGATLELTQNDAYGSQPFRRVFLARGEHAPEPPPGILEVPRPGVVFVSPRLQEVLDREPGLSGLLPGKVHGLIGPEGLGHPNELFAYIGMRPDQLPEGTSVAGFGKRYADSPAVEPSTLDILRFTLAGVVLLPLAVFLSVCARLSAATRLRRLAALRLLGLSIKGIQRVNAAETVVAALLGAVLGLAEYWAVNQLVARVGLPGLKWYVDDGALTATTMAVCLIGCPVLAWFVGRAGAGRAAVNPLATRRSAVAKPPRAWGALLLIAGMGIVAGYCVLGVLDRPPRDTSVSAVLVPVAVVLVGGGLVLTLPILSHRLSRRVAGVTGSLSLGLAMRRNEVEPGSALRVASGLVLLVFAASLAQGVLVELNQVSRPNTVQQDYRIPLDSVDAADENALTLLPGVKGSVTELRSWFDPNVDEPPPEISATVATCAQLAEVVIDTTGCVDGQVMRLTQVGLPPEADRPGEAYPFRFRQGSRQRTVTFTVPHQEVRFQAHALSAVGSAILVPPSKLPRGARPDSSTLVLTSSPDPAVVREVLDGIGGIAPTAAVDLVGTNVEGMQQIAVVKALLGAGMVLGLVIGVAAYLVSVTDRAVERRAQVTALSLLGARPRTLRAVQCAQVVLPLMVGLVLALVTGKLTESSYLITGGGAVFWDGEGIPLLLFSALGVVVVAAVGALPLVGRRVNPELIRRD